MFVFNSSNAIPSWHSNSSPAVTVPYSPLSWLFAMSRMVRGRSVSAGRDFGGEGGCAQGVKRGIEYRGILIRLRLCGREGRRRGRDGGLDGGDVGTSAE